MSRVGTGAGVGALARGRVVHVAHVTLGRPRSYFADLILFWTKSHKAAPSILYRPTTKFMNVVKPNDRIASQRIPTSSR